MACNVSCQLYSMSGVFGLQMAQGGAESNHRMQSAPTSSQFRQTLSELASHNRLTGSVDVDDRLASSSARGPGDGDMGNGDEPGPSSSGQKEELGRINFSVSYDFDTQTLTVKIIRAEHLAAKDLGGTSDPYVKISLLPDKRHTLTTNIKRKNLNPRWNEIFAFEGQRVHSN